MYPQTTWECGVCGSSNQGDIGFCTRCGGGKEGYGGALQRDDTRPSGGLDHGAIPYFPVWHSEEGGFDVHDGYLPCKEKYPHHKRSVRQ